MNETETTKTNDDRIELNRLELKSQSLAKICTDEVNLERQGYRIDRQTIISSSDDNCNCLYRAYITTLGNETIIGVCKIITLNDYFIRQKDCENFLNNSVKIIRFIGGYQQTESKHKLFIHLYEIFKIDMKIYLFMNEFIGKTLLHCIKHHQKFNQNDEHRWIQLICDGIKFLHSNGIAHRSIKLENILISSDDDIKLTGFNRSVIFINDDHNLIKVKHEKKSYNNYYLPPESFDKRSTYDPSIADIWSIGVILIALHTKRYVFNIKSNIDFEQQWKLFVDKHYSIINPLLIDLLNNLFINDPYKRLTLNQFINHQYFLQSPTTTSTTTLIGKNSTNQQLSSSQLLSPSSSHNDTTITTIIKQDNDDKSIIKNQDKNQQDDDDGQIIIKDK